MKILAFTDVHGNQRTISHILSVAKKEDVDFIVCSGDISFFEGNLDKIISRFKETKKPLIIIHGNHESEDFLKDICKKYNFCIYLHKRSYLFENFVFFGYGGGGFSSRYKDLEIITKKFRTELKKDQKVIFVTHAPVYGTKTDYLDLLGHVGSKSARDFINLVNPVAVICGHLHENEEIVDHVGKTLVINPGKNGKILEF